MSTVHGAASRAITQRAVVSGSFGRMFPSSEARRATGLEMAKRFGLPDGKMDGGRTTSGQESSRIHAGFTFLGQFIDHDLTLEATSTLDRPSTPDHLTDFRSPRLDMDNLYGAGPTVSPHLYDMASHATKLLTSADGVDHARTPENVALIGDPRNDENLLLSQLHLALVTFHNQVVDQLSDGTITDVFGAAFPSKPTDEPPTEQPAATLEQLLDVDNYYNELFATAQRLVRWHYQWVVVHDFLAMVADPAVVEDLLKHGPRFFHPGPRPFMPVEFAAAAFRFGHSLIRSDYRINENVSLKIFPDDPDAPTDPRTDLRGGPVDPDHAVDWSFLFATDRGRQAQFARKIQATINTQLLDLPVSAVPGARAGALARPVASLAVRNLLRSESLGLPSGQEVARRIGEIPLTDDELDTSGPVYLWYYVLKEAEVLNGGEHLGPVGSRIVGETLIGLLDADPTSYRSAFAAWKPTLASRNGEFGIADLLRFAGVTGAS
jgi:hypothetical protein